MQGPIHTLATSLRNRHSRDVVFTALFILAFLAVSATAVVSVARSRRRNALGPGSQPKQLGNGSPQALLERGFTDMRVGDIVIYQGADYLVEGVNSYDEAGRHWSMAYIVDGKEKYWLLVGLDRSGSAGKSMLKPTTELDLNDYPPEVLLIDEDRFRFDKRGTATVSLHGNTGGLGGGVGGDDKPGTAHRCRWWSYQGPSDQSLLIEQWGDDYRTLVGRSLGETDVELMPGS